MIWVTLGRISPSSVYSCFSGLKIKAMLFITWLSGSLLCWKLRQQRHYLIAVFLCWFVLNRNLHLHFFCSLSRLCNLFVKSRADKTIGKNDCISRPGLFLRAAAFCCNMVNG